MYQIMNAYSNIMNSLRNLNADSLQKNNAGQPTSRAKILDYLKKYSEFSISELSENLKLKKKDIEKELEPFVKKGIVERKGRGKTLCYRLKEIASINKIENTYEF